MFRAPKFESTDSISQLDLDNLFFEDYLLNANQDGPLPANVSRAPSVGATVTRQGLPSYPKPVPSIDNGVHSFSETMGVHSQMNTNNVPKVEETRKRKAAPDLKARQERTKQRNRVHAKKTRLRKKFFLASLQKELELLKQQTEALKGVIVQNFSKETATQLLHQCCPEDQNQDEREELFGSTASKQAPFTSSAAVATIPAAPTVKAPTELGVSDSSLLMNLLKVLNLRSLLLQVFTLLACRPDSTSALQMPKRQIAR
jgi:hypothetical protein